MIPDLGRLPVGQFLADIRRKAGVSQVAVAEEMDTSQSHVSDVESGTVDPRVSTVVRFLLAVGEVTGRRSPGGVDDRAAVMAAGWRALKEVDRHPVGAPDGCVPCGRYVAALLRGAEPRSVDYLRCPDAQNWQSFITAADELAEGAHVPA